MLEQVLFFGEAKQCEVFKSLDQIAQAADILVRRLSFFDTEPKAEGESALFDGNKNMISNFIDIFTDIRDDCLSRNLKYINPPGYEKYPFIRDVEQVAVGDQPGQDGFIKRFGELPAIPIAGIPDQDALAAIYGMPSAKPEHWGRPPPGQPPGYRRYPEPEPVDMGQYQQVDRGLPPYGDFGPGPRGAEESKGPEIFQEEKGPAEEEEKQERSPEIEEIAQRMISQGLLPERLRRMEMESKEKTFKGRYNKQAFEREKEAMAKDFYEIEPIKERLKAMPEEFQYREEPMEELKDAYERKLPAAEQQLIILKGKMQEAKELKDRLDATFEYYRRLSTKPELRHRWAEFERHWAYVQGEINEVDEIIENIDREIERSKVALQDYKERLRATRAQRKAERAEQKRLGFERRRGRLEQRRLTDERKRQQEELIGPLRELFEKKQQRQQRANAELNAKLADFTRQQMQEALLGQPKPVRPMPPSSFWGLQGLPGQAEEREQADVWGPLGMRRGEGKAKSTKMSKLKKALKQIKRV